MSSTDVGNLRVGGEDVGQLGRRRSMPFGLHELCCSYTKEAVDISKKLLQSNPEHYTGWNYRKLVGQQLLETSPDSDSIQPIVDEELRVVENALKKNLKSYGAWHHHKRILSKGHSSTDIELRLLGKFQKLDARNFHAWNYRR